MMTTWQTLSRATTYQPNNGRWLTVESHTIRLPNGVVIDDWQWVITPDYVNVVLVTEDERFVLFRQTKYAVDGFTLAVVGGYIESEEEPLIAAQREVLEETGYVASEWTSLGKYAVDGNRGAGHAHLFLAQNARLVQSNTADNIEKDDLEEMELLLLTRNEVEAALRRGDFKVLPWATAVALALQHLQQG